MVDRRPIFGEDNRVGPNSLFTAGGDTTAVVPAQLFFWRGSVSAQARTGREEKRNAGTSILS